MCIRDRFHSVEDFLTQLALLTNVEAEAEQPASRDEERLRLSTIHQAKGLEFDVVFIIMLCDGDVYKRQDLSRGVSPGAGNSARAGSAADLYEQGGEGNDAAGGGFAGAGAGVLVGWDFSLHRQPDTEMCIRDRVSAVK